MNPRTIQQALVSAAAFAGAATLLVLWTAERRKGRGNARHELKKQLKTWEGEGGNLAPAPASEVPASS